MKRTLLFLSAMCMLLGISCFAQFENASVLGTVRDSSGAAVVQGTVTLRNRNTGVTTTTATNGSGEYEFPDVKIGQYELKAEAPGFSTTTTNPFQVQVGARQRVDLRLAVSGAEQSVTVTAAAALLETDSSDRGQVIGTGPVVNLPLNGRAYADLALLVPGVRKSVLENQTTTSRDASFNVNGLRSQFNNFILDGLDNNAYGTSNQGFSNQAIQLSPDALAEFKVMTDNYSAEYGHSAGAVIDAATRSGTNEFHGVVYDYLRNTALNAIGPFQPNGNQKPVLVQNQFGATTGGPLLRNKAFFFGDYEGFRNVQKSFTTATIPNTQMRSGKFVDGNGNPIPVMNPYTGAVFADGQVPAGDINPLARLVMGALPAPSIGAITNNYFSFPEGRIRYDKGDIRADYNFNSRLNSFFRFSERQAYIFDPSNLPLPAGGSGNGNTRIFNQQIAAGATWMLNARSTLDARVGFTWTEGGKSPANVGLPSLLVQAGLPNIPTDPRIAGALNTQSLSFFSPLGRQGSSPQFQNPYVVNPTVNYTTLRGHHSLKFGYEYQAIYTAIDDFHPKYGQDIYLGGFSKPAGITVPADQKNYYSAAYALTDFLYGARSQYQLNNIAIVDYNQRMNFLYGQDDWRVSQRLTLNLGLRYELGTPQWVSDNRLANFDPATNSLIQARPGSLYDRALVQMQKTNFGPRVGFAFQATPRTVVRSAYGISYMQFNRMGGENLLAYNGPAIVDATIDQLPPAVSGGLPLCTSTTSNPLTCFRATQQGYPDNFASPSNFNPLKSQARYIPKDNPTSYVQSYHLTVQQQLGPDTAFDIAYVGNRGVHLQILGDYNQAAAQQPGGSLSLQARRPIASFAAIEIAFGGGVSTYNALQAKLEHRYRNGLYVLNSFTWSHATDDAAGHLENVNGDNSRVNIYNIRADYGRSNYDQPLNDTLSLIYDLPYGHGRRFGSSSGRLEDLVLGGWQLTAINQATSGLPVNLSYNATSTQTVSGLLTYRPNRLGDPQANTTPVKTATSLSGYFNKANLAIPASGSPFGNAQRNIGRGPAYNNLDLGLHKQFRLWSEASNLEFRAEAFNVLNHVNYTVPDGNLSNAGFGSITSSYPARQLQFALRLSY